jgi:pimeloyl-ACP methyl ester carboxylesterase
MVLLGVCLVLLVVGGGELARRLTWLAVWAVATAAATIMWRRYGLAGGWVALMFGSIGLLFGLGIGVRRLAEPDWKAVVALIGLVAGIAVVGAGIRRITDDLSTLPTLALGSLLVVLVALVVWTLTPAVIATSVPELAHGSVTPADFGFDASEVRYTTSDGVDLWAWYSPPPSGKVVVLRHGAGDTASDVLPQAKVLVENGFGVLITDARGHGHSGGTAMDFGWYGTLDIEAAVSFLVTQLEVDPDRIGVVGMSMGGEEAIGAAAFDERISAVVAEGATARTDTDKEWLADEYGFRGWIQTKLEWAQYALAGLLTEADTPEPLASAAGLASPDPILMITGGEAPDELHAAQWISSATDNVTIWTVPGAGHTQGLSLVPEEWESRVVGFLEGVLGDQ